MSLTQQTEHVADARENLVEQFQNSPILKAWLDSYTAQIQNIEDALFEILAACLCYATGVTLDGYGSIVGEPRLDRSDDDYRPAISSRIQLNSTSGAPEQVITFLLGLAIAPNTVELVESFPAAFEAIFVDRLDDGVGERIATLLQEASPAGVRATLWWYETDDPFVFYDDPDGSGFDTGEFAQAHDF